MKKRFKPKNEEKPRKDIGWPRAEKVKEAIEVVMNFQMMCKHQLELGYWATVDFPSKHHINKILSLQYMDKATVDRIYGHSLAKRCAALLPLCKNYLEFTKYKENYENMDVE